MTQPPNALPWPPRRDWGHAAGLHNPKSSSSFIHTSRSPSSRRATRLRTPYRPIRPNAVQWNKRLPHAFQKHPLHLRQRRPGTCKTDSSQSIHLFHRIHSERTSRHPRIVPKQTLAGSGVSQKDLRCTDRTFGLPPHQHVHPLSVECCETAIQRKGESLLGTAQAQHPYILVLPLQNPHRLHNRHSDRIAGPYPAVDQTNTARHYPARKIRRRRRRCKRHIHGSRPPVHCKPLGVSRLEDIQLSSLRIERGDHQPRLTVAHTPSPKGAPHRFLQCIRFVLRPECAAHAPPETPQLPQPPVTAALPSGPAEDYWTFLQIEIQNLTRAQSKTQSKGNDTTR